MVHFIIALHLDRRVPTWATIYGSRVTTSFNFPKFGVPHPVTASHPFVAYIQPLLSVSPISIDNNHSH